jgi:signal recognition particle subunit SRP54
MQKMGGMASLMDKLPGMGQIPEEAKGQANDKEVGRMIAIINSMTPSERRHPDLIKGSRKRRIAAGSGTQVQDVNRLLKQHMQMSKAMKQFSKGGMGKLMKAMKGRMPGGGGLPF